MPTSRQTLPTTLREMLAFKVNCVRCEEPAFMSPSGAFSRAKIRVSPSFPESTWAKWAPWKARRELPFDDWQPQVLCLCDTMGHHKSSSFLLLQKNTERKERRLCMMGRREELRGRRRGGGGLAFETGPAQMYGAGGLDCGCRWRSPGSTLPPSWPFVAPSSLGVVSSQPACQRGSTCILTMVPTPHLNPTRPTSDSHLTPPHPLKLYTQRMW